MPTKNKRRAAFRKRLTSEPPPPDEATRAKLEAMTDAELDEAAAEYVEDMALAEPSKEPKPKEPKP